MSNELWKGEVTVLRHSLKATLVSYEGQEAWIPESQIHEDSEVWKKTPTGENGLLIIPEWLARKKDWT